MDIDQRKKKNVLRNKTNISDELPNYFKIKSVPQNHESTVKKTRYYNPILHCGIAKEWPEYMQCDKQLIHNQNQFGTSKTYEEEHSRDNTYKKIKSVGLKKFLNEYSSLSSCQQSTPIESFRRQNQQFREQNKTNIITNKYELDKNIDSVQNAYNLREMRSRSAAKQQYSTLQNSGIGQQNRSRYQQDQYIMIQNQQPSVQQNIISNNSNGVVNKSQISNQHSSLSPKERDKFNKISLISNDQQQQPTSVTKIDESFQYQKQLHSLKKVSNRISKNIDPEYRSVSALDMNSKNSLYGNMTSIGLQPKDQNDTIISTDLNFALQDFRLYESGGNVDKSQVIKVPLKPVQVYNCVTDKNLTYQPPDFEISKGENKFLTNYKKLLNQDKPFNKKLGYFSHMVKNREKLLNFLRNENNQQSSLTVIDKSQNQSPSRVCSKLSNNNLQSINQSKRILDNSNSRILNIDKMGEFSVMHNPIDDSLFQNSTLNESRLHQPSSKLEDIRNKSFKNLLGESNLNSVQTYFQKQRKNNKEKLKDLKQRYMQLFSTRELIGRNSNDNSQMMIKEEREKEEIAKEKQIRLFKQELNEMDKFDQRMRSPSPVSNLARNKHKYLNEYFSKRN